MSIHCRFLPESVTWLFLKGNYKETLTILQSSAKWNKKNLPLELFPDDLLECPTDPNNQKRDDSQSPEVSNFLPDTNQTNHHNHLMPSDTLKKSTPDDTRIFEETNNKKTYLYLKQNGLETSNSEEVQTFQSTSCLTNTEKSQNNAQGLETLSTDIAVTVSIRSLFSTPRMLLYTLITFYLLYVITNSKMFYFIILITVVTFAYILTENKMHHTAG